ncbi:MAG: ABC transporter substrate-binding protein [Candidatus Lambdaproteobacteria bacterium]|nr:ABC transporter substrate-binding protein [Candidatus Lambdaproteobacteria bacterium]
MHSKTATFVLATALALGATHAGPALGQKYGGVLRLMTDGSPASLSIVESASQTTQIPIMPVYSNLALYKPLEPKDSLDSIIPELASSWSWSADGTVLTFKLHQGVTWHDGKPFTAADVKHSFDVYRGAKRSGLKLNPRKDWLSQIREIVTNGDAEVAFHLKAPQPSLLAMLASGAMPVYPGHIDFGELRTRAIGTGPFKLKAYERDQHFTLEKNGAYFVKGRPYLDGIRVNIIKTRVSRVAALIGNLTDMSYTTELNSTAKDQIVAAVPNMRVQLQSNQVSRNIVMNTKKPPFNNPKLRLAVNLAVDRKGFINAVHQGFGAPGGAMLPSSMGVWGLDPEQLARLPGMGDGPAQKEQARQLMKELGYSQENPMRITVVTRATPTYVDATTFVVSELRQVGFAPELQQIDTGPWFGTMTRRDFAIGVNLTATAVDDPDINFFENYTCGTSRNWTDYCNPELQKKIVEQSSTFDPARRLRLVREIDTQLQQDGARPILSHPQGFVLWRPEMKGFVMHNSIYNSYRFQDVWLDR